MHQTIYPDTLAGSKIRALLVDIAAHLWTTDDLRLLHNALKWSDFFSDLSVSMHQRMSAAGQKPPFEVDTCVYHSRREVGPQAFAPCYKTKFRF